MFRLLLMVLHVGLLIALAKDVIGPPQPRYIAHAGGEANNFMYSNSLEALNKSYDKNLRFFEVDLETTSDGEIVLLHDWDYTIEQYYHAEPKVYTLAEFKTLRLYDGLTQMSFKELAGWMEEHPDTYIITDFKHREIRSLLTLSRKYPKLRERIFPQIYHPHEYWEVRAMGFPNIIFTLYAAKISESEILEFVQTHQLWAVAMSVDFAKKSDLPKTLQQLGITTYAHVVNDRKLEEALLTKGITGFYTAFLQP